LSRNTSSLTQFAVHNVDALLAMLALPLFLIAALPLEGWFWAVALWALNRFIQARVERRAAAMGALRAVGVMGASMLLRPWIGMLALFLITRHDSTMAVSSVALFLFLITVDIAIRILTHKNIRAQIGGVAQ
jgi:hypothetical protein